MMETTPQRTLRAARNIPESVRAGARELREMDRESQYDLLTAAVLGAAIGAGIALLVSSVSMPSRPVRHPVRKAMNRGGKWARQRGSAIGEMLDPESLRDNVRDYVESARDTVSDTVESELKDLRRSIRRQRRRLGL